MKKPIIIAHRTGHGLCLAFDLAAGVVIVTSFRSADDPEIGAENPAAPSKSTGRDDTQTLVGITTG
ncbi:hypothetical protein MINS_37180 [Mycolicibacterium insubricum]|uniref:hypothetical protein n=1 Tax=Mycolicibacterium insubricum TaxID=444597 RepID=UPI00138C6D1A|nr:hypothetical protein [Mycolicibacterium insubricum]BBZ68289.1 hypothetical protein MINS_37180 [Mycolicibacterium insubricum]